MKLGLGLYRHMLHQDYYAFAVQTGCTHVVAHLVDYFRGGSSNPRNNQPTGGKDQPWGVAGDPDKLWTLQELVSLKREIEAAGLKLEAIENLDPAHWHDILLDGPKRALHIENVKTVLRRMGEAGIPVLGYNFSIAGVCGRDPRTVRPGRRRLSRNGRSRRHPNSQRRGVEHDLRRARSRRRAPGDLARRTLASSRALPGRCSSGRRSVRRATGRASR